MKARLLLSAGSPVADTVARTTGMRTHEEEGVTTRLSMISLPLLPRKGLVQPAPHVAVGYTTRTRRKSSPAERNSIPRSLSRPDFLRLRIDIPTRSKFSGTVPDRSHKTKSLFKQSSLKSSPSISNIELTLVRRIVALPEGDQRAFADGRQLYALSRYPLVPVCAELNNRDWDLSTFDTSNCCDHVTHHLAKKDSEDVGLVQRPHTAKAASNSHTPSLQEAAAVAASTDNGGGWVGTMLSSRTGNFLSRARRGRGRLRSFGETRPLE